MFVRAVPGSAAEFVAVMPLVPTVALLVQVPSPPAMLVTCCSESDSPAPAFTGFVSSMCVFLLMLRAVEHRCCGLDRARGVARVGLLLAFRAIAQRIERFVGLPDAGERRRVGNRDDGDGIPGAHLASRDSRQVLPFHFLHRFSPCFIGCWRCLL